MRSNVKIVKILDHQSTTTSISPNTLKNISIQIVLIKNKKIYYF